MNWFYMDGDKQEGPLTDDEIGSLIEADKLTEDTLVWNETLTGWTRLIDSGLVETEEVLSQTPQSSSDFPILETPAKMTFAQKIMDSFSVAKKRIALARDMRQANAERVSVVQERDVLWIAIGTRVQEFENLEASSFGAEALSQAIIGVNTAQNSLENALNQSAQTMENVRLCTNRLAELQKDNSVKLSRLGSEYDTAASETGKLDDVVSSITSSTRIIEQQLKQIRSEIADASGGKAQSRPAEILIAEKSKLEERRAELLESIKMAKNQADAARAISDGKKTALAQAKTAASNLESEAKGLLRAAGKTHDESVNAVSAAKSGLQMARKVLGKTVCDNGIKIDCCDDLLLKSYDYSTKLLNLDNYTKELNMQLDGIKPSLNRLLRISALFIFGVICALGVLGAFLYSITTTTSVNTSQRSVGKSNNDPAQKDNDEDDESDKANTLRKKAGQNATFEISQQLSFDDFPALEGMGIAAYEIMLWTVGEDRCSTSKELSGLFFIPNKRSGGRPLGKAILVTTETIFKSKGEARLSLIKSGKCGTIDMSGFTHDTVIFTEAKTADILAYRAAEGAIQPFFDLIKKNDIETLTKFLADNKVNMEAETVSGKTPLMLALDVVGSNQQLLDLLVSNGANINVRSSEGEYPLLYAIKKRKDAEVVWLLERGANQGVRSGKGEGALELAIRFKLPSSIIDKLSQNNGADVNRMIENMPLLCYSIMKSRYDESLKLLGAGADPNAVCATTDRSSPLILASSKGAESVVQALLSAGAKIDYKNQNGATALHMAALYGHPKIISLLGRHGADVNVQTDSGHTALMYCLEKRFAPKVEGEIMRELCSRKANVNLKDNRKNTVLHYAVLNKREEALRELLAAEADVNLQNDNGDTPLHFAAKAGLIEFIKLLLRFEANKDIKNHDGQTPYRVASSNAKMDAAEMLK